MYKLYIYIPLTFFIVHREDEIQLLPPVEPLLPPPLLENNGRQIAQIRGRGGEVTVLSLKFQDAADDLVVKCNQLEVVGN